MGSQIDRIQDILKVLVGLPLSHSFRAAGMRMLHFGKARVVENGRVGDYALHLQCPWRVEGPDGIVTGSDDLWEPANEDDWHENWSYDGSVTLQDAQLRELLGEPGIGTTSPNGEITGLIVEAVEAAENGDLSIVLTGGYNLAVFVCGCRDESWRFFSPKSGGGHLVFIGGKMSMGGGPLLSVVK